MRVAKYSPAFAEASALVRRYRAPLLLALLLVVVNRLAALSLPAASKYVVDEIIGGHRPELLVPVALVLSATVLLDAITAFGAAHVAGIAGQRAIADSRRELQGHLLRLPLKRLDASQSGTLASRVIADSEQVRYLIGSGSVQLASSVLTAILALALLLHFNAPAGIAVAGILTVVLAGFATGFRRISSTLERVAHVRAELTGQLTETLNGSRVVKAYLAERREAHRFTQQVHRLLRDSIQAVRGISHFNACTTLVAGGIGAFLLLAGARAVTTETMSLGSLVMYLSLTSFLLAPVVQVAATAGDLGNAAAALGRIAELRGWATEEHDDRHRARISHVKGAVDFDRVSYAYVLGQWALREVSFHAEAGSVTAVVGLNGSGKSTLCRLLLAYEEPTWGRVLVDGRDLAGVRRRDYRSHVGVVLHDDLLFDGTIAENIRYGRPGTSLSEMRAVARLAHCSEFIELLPDGYSTMLGQGGARLSAGQRQRLAIARALLLNPSILILDEATASLDADSEALIRDALRSLCLGRTTFVVSHHFWMTQAADQILVLEEGGVVEQGWHEELLSREGRYWKLYHARREPKRDRSLGFTHGC